MVINKIHLGPVLFARTLAASIAARQSASAASGGCPRVNRGIPHATERAVLRDSNYFLKGREELPRTRVDEPPK